MSQKRSSHASPHKERLPLRKALTSIALSLGVVLVTALGGLKGFRYYTQLLQTDDSYAVKEILQASGTTERLPTAYFCELLGLSTDMPTQLIDFDLAKGKERLMRSPLLKEVSLKKKNPNALVIHYLMRTPIAAVGDIFNCGIDDTGVTFPLNPFYTPKKLPEIIFGENELRYGKRVSEGRFTIAKTIIEYMNQSMSLRESRLKTIDLSEIAAPSLGKRSITLVLENPRSTHFVRLHHQHYMDSLANYLEMQGEMLFQEQDREPSLRLKKIIDLRIEGYAYVDEVKEAG